MQVDWHESIESLFEEICDEAQLRSTLHMKQHLSYRSRNQWYTLPVVVLSVLSGSGNFISESFEKVLVKKYMILGIGLLSIFTSVISAISHHLKLAELSEANRIASLTWGKYYSRLKFQLSLQRKDRESCYDFMNSAFAEYNRMFEISPILLEKFIKHVKKKLKKRTFDNNFILPYYLNGFQHVRTYGNEVWEENTVEDEKAPN